MLPVSDWEWFLIRRVLRIKVNQMNIALAKKRLRQYAEEQMPCLLVGRPGIGKTDIGGVQLAAELGWDLLVTHPVTKSGVDYSGLPYCRNGDKSPEALWLPYGDLRWMVEAKRPSIVLIDDAGQAANLVQAALMQIVWGRAINEHKVSKFVSFILASNRREDRSAVNGILEAFKDRMIIINVEPSLPDWAKWALANGVPDVVVSHARFYAERPGGMFNPPPITGDFVNRPTPRSVVRMGKQYNLGIDDVESLAGSVGERYASDFVGFARMRADLPTPEEIIANPLGAPVPDRDRNGLVPAAALYAIVTAIAGRGNAKTARPILQYINRLPKEFLQLGVRDLCRKYAGTTSTPEFLKISMENQELTVQSDN